MIKIGGVSFNAEAAKSLEWKTFKERYNNSDALIWFNRNNMDLKDAYEYVTGRKVYKKKAKPIVVEEKTEGGSD